VAGATLGATAVLAANAEADTYTVNSTADDGTGMCNPSPDECTLRDAVTTANENGTPDTVDLSGVSGTITLDPSNGAIGITDPDGLNINGAGAGALTVSGGSATGIFQITGDGAVSISGLTLTDGSSATNGGAIEDTSAPLTLTNVTISGNSTTEGGGGVYSNRELTISGSSITGNTAGLGGGIATTGFAKYSAGVTVDDSTISGNTAQTGGGIFAFGGSVSLTGSTISGNTSAERGGGVLSLAESGTTIDRSTLSNNTATDGGGGLYIGAFPLIAPDDNPVLVQDSTISGNHAANGAGIEIGDNSGSTPVTVRASTISGNQGGDDSFGGGLLIAGPLFNAFDLVNSTISGNSATDGGGVSLGLPGNALLGPDGSISFDNSTIAQNAAGASSGGGIYLGQYGSDSGYQSGTAAINSTIVAGNAPDDLFRPASSTSGGFNDTFSLIQNPGNAPLLGSQALITGVDPQLGSLADNGGPTETMLPSNTSPVIDQGKAQAGLTTDQRGEPRTVDNGKPEPQGGDGTDIGAVDVPLIPPAPPPPPPPPPTPPVVAKPPVVPKPRIVVTTQCKSRRHFTIRLKERPGRLIRSAKVLVHGRRVAVVRRRSDRRLVAVVDLRGLPKGTYRVVIRARLRNGHRARWVRSYRTCIGPLPSSNHLEDPRAL
jgi:CSLREA domain-containing protein